MIKKAGTVLLLVFMVAMLITPAFARDMKMDFDYEKGIEVEPKPSVKGYIPSNGDITPDHYVVYFCKSDLWKVNNFVGGQAYTECSDVVEQLGIVSYLYEGSTVKSVDTSAEYDKSIIYGHHSTNIPYNSSKTYKVETTHTIVHDGQAQTRVTVDDKF